MRIGIATDHNGVEEKKILIAYLEELGYVVEDFSQNNTPIDDYPDFASDVCHAVIEGRIDNGILMCGTGIGMSIAANKIKGIRCAKVSRHDEAILAKQHNNANVMALSYKESIEDLKKMVKNFVESTFANDERHVRRLAKIDEIEASN